jgi:hypothetical protein
MNAIKIMAIVLIVAGALGLVYGQENVISHHRVRIVGTHTECVA